MVIEDRDKLYGYGENPNQIIKRLDQEMKIKNYRYNKKKIILTHDPYKIWSVTHSQKLTYEAMRAVSLDLNLKDIPKSIVRESVRYISSLDALIKIGLIIDNNDDDTYRIII